MQNFDKRIFFCLKVLLALALLSPLLIAPSLIFPFTAPKAFVFRMLIELAAAFYLYLAIRYPSLRPPKNFLVFSAAVFLAVFFISSWFGMDLSLSFWGNAERMGGFFNLAHFFLYFIMLAGALRGEGDWSFFLRISSACAGLVALSAVLQRWTDLAAIMPQDGRPFGLIGNAGFLGSYLVLNIFVSIYLCLKELRENNFWIFSLAVLSTILQVAAVILSGTRGAFLGLIAGLAVFACLWLVFSAKEKKQKLFGAGALALTAIFILLILFNGKTIFPQGSVFDRLANWRDVTAQNRLLLWQASWGIWQTNPVLGVGPENFETAFDRQFSPELGQYNSFYDRAHNFIFDYGVTTGWLGLAAYLAVLGAAFRLLFKNLSRDFWFSVCFLSLLAGYLIQNAFIFDAFVSYLILFFALAACLGFFRGSEPIKWLPVKKLWLGIFLLAAFFLVYFQNIKPWVGISQVSRAMAQEAVSVQATNQLFEKGFNNAGFARAEMVYQSVLDYLDKIQQVPSLAQNEGFFLLAQDNLKKSIEISPTQGKNYLALAWLDLYFSDGHTERVEEALSLSEKARQLSPAKKDVYQVSLASYSLAGLTEEGENLIEQISGRDEKMGLELKKYWEQIK